MPNSQRSIAAFCKAIGLSRRLVDRAIKTGEIRTATLAGRVFVAAGEEARLKELLQAGDGKAKAPIAMPGRPGRKPRAQPEAAE